MTFTRSFRPRRAAAALVSLLAVVGAGLALAEDTSSTIVAKVNGEVITERDVQFAVQDFRDTLQQLAPADRLPTLINGIIDIRLMARAAEADNIDKNEDTARLLAFIHDRALRSEYLRVKVFKSITDDSIKARYDAETAKFVPGDEVHAVHILVEAEDAAKDIIAKLDAGGDFAAIAKEKSTDVGSGTNGGDLGFLKRGQTVKPFEDAAFALEVGAYTKTPVKSDFGFHVIKVLEKRKSAPPTFDERKAAIREAMAKELFLAETAKLRAAAKVEIMAPPVADGAAAPALAPAPAPAK